MLLAIDVGNSHIVLGCIENGAILHVMRMATNWSGFAIDYAVKLREIFRMEDIDEGRFDGAILSSVVPEVTDVLAAAVKRLLGLDCLIVGSNLDTGLEVCLDVPGQLAPDILAGDVGALSEHRPPLIVLDMGTATTIAVINSAGRHIGGAILPGAGISLAALTAGTSLLPSVSIEAPARCISANTVDCMKSGLVFGTAALIDGMIDRMEGELGEKATVIATGGLAHSIVPNCRRKVLLEPDLLLKGLWVLYQRNIGQK
ncbi:MAG: type III pantothenate kinase [Oscillospiraceae bacterium]|nr:type III pantothenate kinase [Oscillospiraceae bacterium]